ncbi:hypothetical protein [Chryseobacterium tongliaoense]|uniref:hypothetical protein n=1 Tax=Chryseobacterium tongliaoense TaxID=3240933 RepID=UPI0035155FD1
MKKLSRTKLKTIRGALSCAGCPVGNNYGIGPNYSNTCEDYYALSDNCKRCVDVSADC